MSTAKQIQIPVNGKTYTADFGHVWFIKFSDEIAKERGEAKLSTTEMLTDNLMAGMKAHWRKSKGSQEDMVPGWEQLHDAICDLSIEELNTLTDAINGKKKEPGEA